MRPFARFSGKYPLFFAYVYDDNYVLSLYNSQKCMDKRQK